MKKIGLPLLILLMSVIYIFIIPPDPHALKMLFKLIPMWLIMTYAYLHFPAKKGRYSWLMFIGLFFCMLGDWSLQWFVIGLTAFLIGHIFYLTAFIGQWNPSKLRFFSIIPLILFGVFMSNKLILALKAGDQGGLILPVLLYVIVISLMGWSAIMTGDKWASAGAILFIISDTILSWNMFIEHVPYSGVWIMVTYYSAQFLMACSIPSMAQKQHHKFLHPSLQASSS